MYITFNWTADSPISAHALNYVGDQYAAMEDDVDAHLHPAVHYTKAESDSEFFPEAAGLDADKIDGYHASDLMAATLPVGSIMIWSGDDGDVPTGWHICDGSTIGGLVLKDIRAKFVVGAGGAYAPGDTGGATTVSDAGGTVTYASHVLTLAEIPAHYHGYNDYYRVSTSTSGHPYMTPGSYALTSVISATLRTSGSLGSGSGHTHGTDDITFAAFSKMPAYRSLYYIEKVTA